MPPCLERLGEAAWPRMLAVNAHFLVAPVEPRSGIDIGRHGRHKALATPVGGTGEFRVAVGRILEKFHC